MGIKDIFIAQRGESPEARGRTPPDMDGQTERRPRLEALFQIQNKTCVRDLPITVRAINSGESEDLCAANNRRLLAFWPAELSVSPC